MLQIVWRVEALSLPTLSLPCARCVRVSAFRCTERFRVNANGGLLDVWLLYRCEVCAEVHKERIHRRVRPDALAPALLDAYQGDSPTAVVRCAFAAARGVEVAYRVVRDALPVCGALRARIAQTEPCGVRWDRLLAREVGWSRSRVLREAGCGRVRVNAGAELRRVVEDGDVLELALTSRAAIVPLGAVPGSPRARG